MRLLLGTHAFIWWSDEPEKLSERVLEACQNNENHLILSIASIWEMQIKALGLLIGSGIVESTCKWLIQQRFKGVGMRWSEKGFSTLLHLRLKWVNEGFDDLFSASPNS